MVDFRKILILPTTSILDAMKCIDAAASQIVIIVDEEQRLKGTVTDGDIRRGILRGVDLQSPVQEIMNPSPIFATYKDSYHKILAIFQKKKLRQLPIVDEQMRVIDLKFAENFINLTTNDNAVVLMAGGLGSRLHPLTETTPKPMLTVGTKPILETILDSFIEYGFHKFYISVNYKKEIIKDYFGDGSNWGVSIQYLDEDQRLGTAGALSLIEETMDKPLIVMNGDLLTKVNFKQLLDFHEESHSHATMCVREYHHQIPYGVVRTDGHHFITIEEKPTQTFFVNAGIYVLSPETLQYVPKEKYFDMPSLFETLVNKNYEICVFPIREYWLDIGRMTDFERAKTEYAEVFL